MHPASILQARRANTRLTKIWDYRGDLYSSNHSERW